MDIKHTSTLFGAENELPLDIDPIIPTEEILNNNLHIGDRWKPFINPPVKLPPGYIELTLTDGTIVNGMTAADVAACSTHMAASSNITVGGVTFRKDQVKKVRFGEDFNLTSLSIFGKNFTNLIEIDRIPAGITGVSCLQYFLQGCTSFNQPIIIPEGVNGGQCLQGFLIGCTSFDQPITIPEGVTGDYCLNNFLQNCKFFNQPINIPEGVTGNSCLSYFLQGCTSFNQPIIIPEGVNGESCLWYFLYGCTSFNQPITIPEGVTGNNCLSNFLQNCNNMISPVTVNDASGLVGNNNTLSTNSNIVPMYVQGVPIIGSDAFAFKTKFPNNDTTPFRNLI